MLYCIKHESMEEVEFVNGTMGHVEMVVIDDYPFHEIDFCELEEGWAACPPPEFDMDEYVESLGYDYEEEEAEDVPFSVEDEEFYSEWLAPRLQE